MLPDTLAPSAASGVRPWISRDSAPVVHVRSQNAQTSPQLSGICSPRSVCRKHLSGPPHTFLSDSPEKHERVYMRVYVLCMCISVQTCISVCTYLCVCVCICVHISLCMGVYLCAHISVYVSIAVCARISGHVCAHISAYVCVLIHYVYGVVVHSPSEKWDYSLDDVSWFLHYSGSLL